MKLRRPQQGNSMLGMLGVLLMLGFFAMCAIRMLPVYFEYLSVKDIISRIAEDTENQDIATGSIRRKIQTIYHTNQIYGVDAKSVEVYRKKGKTFIDASYEVRQPVFWRIDSVLKFDDLHYEVGNPEPVERSGPSSD